MIILPYKTGDELSILALFKECFGKKITKEYWQWRFARNPLNHTLINLAWDDIILAGHYAVSPILMSIEGRKCLTTLSVTTMVHPRYRGLKLFTQLANQVYEQAANLDYLMVWGFPNDKSHKTFIKNLRWVDVYEIPIMHLNVVHSVRKSTNDITRDDRFEYDYSDRIYSSNLIHVIKSSEYLKWRYNNNPINQYANIVVAQKKKISSFCVVKKYLNSLDIVDFQARDKDEGEYLLNQILFFAYINKLKYVSCWAPRHHFIHSLCEKLGFINKEPITYLGFKQLSKNKLDKISDNYSDWYIQMGDSDVY